MTKKLRGDNKSSLANQSPKKKRRKTEWPRIFLVAGSLLAALIVLFMFRTIPKKIRTNPEFLLKLQGLAYIHENQKLAEFDKLIRETYAKTDDMDRAAKLLQNESGAASVKIFKVNQNKFNVIIIGRQPVIKVKINQEVFLATVDGTLYRHGGETLSDDLAIFSGLSIPTLQWREDMSANLSETHQKDLNAAIELLTKAKQLAIKFDKIELIKHRGFSVVLHEPPIEVTIGFSPFDQRLQKLTEILTNLRSSNTKAARIELDFEGKAFVKEAL